MMMKVNIVIPNYNGASNIGKLLSKVLKFGFNKVFVLDDLSTDNSLEVLKRFEDRITIVKGDKNLGPGGNSNRILDYISDMKSDDLIFFCDADTELIAVDLSSLKNYFRKNKSVGIVGGKICTTKNEPMWWNFGHEMHPVNSSKELAYMDVAQKNWKDKSFLNSMRDYVKDYSYNLEMSMGSPSNLSVDWVSEANMTIRSSLFKKLGGFDAKMRYHAGQDLCKRARQSGYRVGYNPFIIVKHLEIDTFGSKRDKISRENAYYFYKKHWNMSRQIFDKLYPSKE